MQFDAKMQFEQNIQFDSIVKLIQKILFMNWTRTEEKIGFDPKIHFASRYCTSFLFEAYILIQRCNFDLTIKLDPKDKVVLILIQIWFKFRILLKNFIFLLIGSRLLFGFFSLQRVKIDLGPKELLLLFFFVCTTQSSRVKGLLMYRVSLKTEWRKVTKKEQEIDCFHKQNTNYQKSFLWA